MIDVQLFGLHAGPHHIESLVLHCFNSVLLLAALFRLTGGLWRSAFAAALFALHPLRVESVAWVAERKDVLSGLFWMLTLVAYAWYASRPSRFRFSTVTLLLLLGLMSKPSVVTLPFVLVLLDYWPLGRWRTLRQGKAMLLEKWPMLAMAGLVSVATFVGQRQMGAVVSLDALPFYFRVWNGIVSYVRYLGKMVWPVDLGVMYPLAKIHPVELWGSVLLLAALTALAWIRREKQGYLIVGWLWFLGAMVPMLGLAQSGTQAMADRFTYLPMTGIVIAVSWGIADLAAKWRLSPFALAAGGGLLLGSLTFLSFLQAARWKDSVTLFEHTLAVTSDNDMMLVNLANLKNKAGDLDRAIALYEEALRLEPAKTPIRIAAATLLFRQGKYERAQKHFEEALRREPGNPEAQRYIADCLLAQGRKQEARQMLEQLLRQWPNDVEARARLLMLR